MACNSEIMGSNPTQGWTQRFDLSNVARQCWEPVHSYIPDPMAYPETQGSQYQADSAWFSLSLSDFVCR